MSRFESVPDVSVVIVNYKTSALVRDCLESIIAKVAGVSYEVIVVDNASRDDIAEVVNDFRKSQFRTILLDRNIGFGQANNKGFEVARGSYIFCLNPDTVLLNDALTILVNFLENHPKAGICGGNLYGYQQEPVLSFRRRLPGIMWEFNEVLNHIPDKILHGRNRRFNYTDKPLKVGYIMGADMMIRREVIEQTKGFSPEFFMYFEETDLCYKAKKLGWEIFSVPQAKILHLEGASYKIKTDCINYSRIERSEKSRRIYYGLNVGRISRFLSFILYYIFLLSRSKLIKEPLKKGSYQYRLNILRKPDKGG